MAPPVTSSNPFDVIGPTIQAALGDWLGAGQVALGAVVVLAGVLMLIGQTRAGGELAAAGRKVGATAVKVGIAVAK